MLTYCVDLIESISVKRVNKVGYYPLTMDDEKEENKKDSASDSDPLYFDQPQVVTDRPRGILSKTDREYLIGEKKYEHPQSDAKRRQEIRKRIKHSLFDYHILVENLSKSEREKIFEELPSISTDLSFSSVISFLYLALDGDIERLEEIISQGVLGGSFKFQIDDLKNALIDVDVEIDGIQPPDSEDLFRRLEMEREGEVSELSPAEIGFLVRSGDLEPEDLEELRRHSQPSNTSDYFHHKIITELIDDRGEARDTQ